MYRVIPQTPHARACAHTRIEILASSRYIGYMARDPSRGADLGVPAGLSAAVPREGARAIHALTSGSSLGARTEYSVPVRRGWPEDEEAPEERMLPEGFVLLAPALCARCGCR